MLYGERLKLAIESRQDVIGRNITRLELAGVAGCSRQNIGMILTNAKNVDQKLSSESHSAVAAFLRVNPDWLLNEVGEMLPPAPANAPSHLSPAAIEMGVLYDLIPADDKIRRAMAFNLATTAIMQVLQGASATRPQAPE